MHKRKLDSRAEEISATNRAKKPFVEGNSSPKETLDNDTEVIVSVEEMSPELEDLEEEKELEIRDKLLEESSVSLKTRQFVNTNNQDLKLIKLKGKLPNLSLPPGWIALSHRSGGIIYLHRLSRVCTWARPYHIGDASVRKHDVPTAAIPCLHQLNALKESGHGKAQKEHANDAILSNFVTSSNDCRSSGQDDEAGKTGYYGNSNQCGNHGDETKQDRCQDNCDVFCRHDSYAGSSESQPGHNVSKDLDSTLNPSKHCHDLNKLDCKISSPNILGDDLGIDCRSDCNLSSNNDPGDIYTNFENSDDNFHNDCNYSDHNSFNHIDNHESDINHMKGSQSSKNDTYSQTSENVTGQDKNKHSKNLFQIGSGEVEMTTTSELSDYLSKLWEFQRITEEEEKVPLLNPRDNKTPKDGEENGLADVLKTIPYLVQGCDPNIKSKDNLINPAGKSPQSLLHEYCTRFLKLKPAYNTVESGNSKAPFLATVEINGLQYGTGIGASKKQARHIAAQATLDILVPGTYEKVPDVGQHLEVFDGVSIEDPKVYDLTSQIGLMSPSQMLTECVKRNQGVLTSGVKFEMIHNPDGRIYYSIECGKHKATGPCKNKKSGRELAAQAILQKLHPHLNSWGSLMRIYIDKHSVKEFTKTNDKALSTSSSSSLNKELLSDLKHEMWKLLKNRKLNHSASLTTTELTNIDF